MSEYCSCGRHAFTVSPRWWGGRAAGARPSTCSPPPGQVRQRHQISCAAPGERRRGSSARWAKPARSEACDAELVEPGGDPGPLGRAEVLPHHRVPHHGRGARRAARCRSRKSAAPAATTVAGTSRASSSAPRSRSSRASWSGQTYDVSSSRPSVVVGSTGCEVAAGALDHDEGPIQRRQPAVPRVGEHDGRLRRADRAAVGELDPEPVGAQVQPGAGTDLDQPQRPRRRSAATCSRPPTSAAARPTSLVCGGWPRPARSSSTNSASTGRAARPTRRPGHPCRRPTDR